MSALEVLAANGVDVMLDADDGFTPTPVVSHAILAYNRGRHDRPRRRHRDHALAQSARVRRVQVQPALRRPRRHRDHDWIQDKANALLADGLRGVSASRYERARAPRPRIGSTTSAPT